MTDVNEYRAEQQARKFHEVYERLAARFGYKTREASAVPWDEVPEQNRNLMIAVAKELLLEVRFCAFCDHRTLEQPYLQLDEEGSTTWLCTHHAQALVNENEYLKKVLEERGWKQ